MSSSVKGQHLSNSRAVLDQSTGTMAEITSMFLPANLSNSSLKDLGDRLLLTRAIKNDHFKLSFHVHWNDLPHASLLHIIVSSVRSLRFDEVLLEVVSLQIPINCKSSAWKIEVFSNSIHRN